MFFWGGRKVVQPVVAWLLLIKPLVILNGGDMLICRHWPSGVVCLQLAGSSQRGRKVTCRKADIR